MSNEKGTLINPICITNAFSNYFVVFGPILASKIPVTAGNSINYIRIINFQSMYLVPTDVIEISSNVQQLNQSASQGQDSISTRIVKQCIPYVVEPLCDIFNKSLTAGVFSDKLKIANVIPVYKANYKKSGGNYKPIFLKNA